MAHRHGGEARKFGFQTSILDATLVHKRVWFTNESLLATTTKLKYSRLENAILRVTAARNGATKAKVWTPTTQSAGLFMNVSEM